MLQRLKKIISALTVTAMIFGIMPIGAFAENLNKADYEELNDGYLKVVVSAKNGVLPEFLIILKISKCRN